MNQDNLSPDLHRIRNRRSFPFFKSMSFLSFQKLRVGRQRCQRCCRSASSAASEQATAAPDRRDKTREIGHRAAAMGSPQSHGGLSPSTPILPVPLGVFSSPIAHQLRISLCRGRETCLRRPQRKFLTLEQSKNKVNCRRLPMGCDSALRGRGEIGAPMRLPANLQECD